MSDFKTRGIKWDVIISKDFLCCKQIPDYSKLLYIYLKSWVNPLKNTCFPSQKLILSHLNLKEKKLTSEIGVLVELGLLEVEKKRSKKTGRFNVSSYTLVGDECWMREKGYL